MALFSYKCQLNPTNSSVETGIGVATQSSYPHYLYRLESICNCRAIYVCYSDGWMDRYCIRYEVLLGCIQKERRLNRCKQSFSLFTHRRQKKQSRLIIVGTIYSKYCQINWSGQLINKRRENSNQHETNRKGWPFLSTSWPILPRALVRRQSPVTSHHHHHQHHHHHHHHLHRLLLH